MPSACSAKRDEICPSAVAGTDAPQVVDGNDRGLENEQCDPDTMSWAE